MISTLLQDGYWYMFLQVIVTMLIFPFFAYKRLAKTMLEYCDAYYADAKCEVSTYLQFSKKAIFSISLICFGVGLMVILQALYSQNELFGWDNQAGLIVLFFVAMVPVLRLMFLQKGAFTLLKSHAGSVRSASLKVDNWKDYFSMPLLALILLGQVLFIYTVFYFVQHPFDGFAGYANLIGLLVLDALFVAISVVIFRNRRFASLPSNEQRQAIKRKAIQLNCAVWIIALFHLSLSMWVASLNKEALALPLQSFYLQVVIFLTIFALALPRPFLQLKSHT